MNAIIENLQSRNSVKFVQAPGPSEEELAALLQSAMSAPDHGMLRPWRFKRIRSEDVGKLIELAIAARADEGNPLTEPQIATMQRWLSQVPVLLAVACYIDHSNERIPEQERILSTGAAVMNILNAAHSLGYGAFWSTGIGTYTEAVPAALGFDDLEHYFMGFISIGTPLAEVRPKERPNYEDHFSVWDGAV